MNNTIVFTITKYLKGGLPLIDIETKHKDFKKYNLEKVSALRVFEKMEDIATKVNEENNAVLFEIG